LSHAGQAWGYRRAEVPRDTSKGKPVSKEDNQMQKQKEQAHRAEGGARQSKWIAHRDQPPPDAYAGNVPRASTEG